jgi:hypothetical protein
MEKQIALVNKITNRVENILVVDSLDEDKIQPFATVECNVVPVTTSIPYVNGLWNGTEFTAPTTEYLIEIGLVSKIIETTEELLGGN